MGFYEKLDATRSFFFLRFERNGKKKIHTHSVPRLQTDSTVARFSWWKHQNSNDGQHRAIIVQLRRNDQYSPVFFFGEDSGRRRENEEKRETGEGDQGGKTDKKKGPEKK